VHLQKETLTHTGTLEDIERKHIAPVLEKTGWRIGGQGAPPRFLSRENNPPCENEETGIKRSSKPVTN